MVEHLAVADGHSTIEDEDGIEQSVLLHSYNMMMAHYVIRPGAESSYHNHPHEQMGFVVSGEGTQIVDGEEYPLEAGMCYRLASGEMHSMRASSDEPLEVVDVFHPVREDYMRE